MIPVIQTLLQTCGYTDHPAVRQAIEDACHNQTSFVDEVLDVPGVNERVFLQALAKLLDLPWWKADPDKTQDRSLRRYLPADVALKNRLLPIGIDTKPSENAAQAIDQASAVEAIALHIATSDPLSLVARQQLAGQRQPAGRVACRCPAPASPKACKSSMVWARNTFEKILRGRVETRAQRTWLMRSPVLG